MEARANRRRNHCTPHHASELESQTQVQLDSEKASWQWDIKTDVTTWSEQLYHIAGRDPETTLPSFKEHSCFYTSDSWHRLIGATLRVLRTGQPYELELQMRRPDGTRRRVMGNGEAVRDAKGDILRLCGTVEDITERNWQVIGADEPESRTIDDYSTCARLIQAQDEENAGIARELRDHICQKLCLVAVEIQGLALESTQQAQLRLEELWRNTAETVDDIIRVSQDLYPANLDVLGLPLAIRGLCREFASRHAIAVECSCTDVVPEKIGKDLARTFFRVLRDALGNVAKPGHAIHVSVELIASARELMLRVSDDGVGLHPGQTKVTTSFALIRMKERLRSIGGVLEVWSVPTRGTRIEGRAPLRESLQ
ncbi:MAG TPA: PAS domain-containing protein [Candidatus Sulfotelmatobacter sp.]